MVIKRVSINNKEQHAPSPVLHQYFSVGNHSSWPGDYTQPRARLKSLGVSEFSSGWRGTLNVKRCRAEVAIALCACFMHNPLIYNQKYVANARIYGLPRGSWTRVISCDVLSLFLSAIRLLLTSEICINLGNAREARNRKFSIAVPPVLTARGVFPCLLRARAAPREFRPTQRWSLLGRRGREEAAAPERRGRRVLWRIKSKRFPILFPSYI